MDLLIEIFCLCSILLVGLFLRAIPHIRSYFPGTPDTFFFLNKLKNPDYKSEEVVYPKLFIQFLNAIVRNGEHTNGRNLNRFSVLLDLLTASIVYLFIRSQYLVEIALLAALLFLISPYVVRQGTTLSARTFGIFLASVSVLTTSLPFPLNWLAFVPIGMTLLSHRLSTQALIAIFVGLSMINLQNALILATGFVFAILVSKGEYVTILRAHGATITKHYRSRGYPNERLTWSILTPAFLGYLIFLGIFIIQRFSIILIGGFTIPPLFSVNAEFEMMMIIWASACAILFIFWLAGESYKHLSVAAVPFAFLTSLLANTDMIFLLLAVFVIFLSLLESFYFQLRFQHINEDQGHLLKIAASIKVDGSMFAPAPINRAASFLSSHRVTPTYLHEWDQEDFSRRVREGNVSLAFVMEHEKDWFSEWTEIDHSGSWLLFQLT